MKPTKFQYTDADGDPQTISISYEVDDRGIFTAIVPDWLYPNVKALNTKPLALHKPRTNWRLSARTKMEIDELLKQAFADYSAPQIETTEVILYTWDAQAAFVVGPNPDEIYQHGGFAKDTKWADLRCDLHATHPAQGGYQIRLAAYVYNKTVTTRGAYQNITYERSHDGHLSPDPANPIHMLNSFRAQGGITYEGKPMVFGTRVEEMPYTPEAAMFFVNALFGMCRMARAMDGFFRDPVQLQAAIASGGIPLLTSQ